MTVTHHHRTGDTLFGIVAFLALMPFYTPTISLALGIAMAFAGIKSAQTARLAPKILQASVVLMGFGMNLPHVVATGLKGIGVTAVSVIGTLLLGLFLAKQLKVNRKTGWLIAAGTAICGGSAIAAIAPAIDARDTDISFSLIVVFVLNAFALLLFPIVGHYLGMEQETFGLWSAIAIHDTSSVVGAGSAYGMRALEVATTVKLTRALWIVPVTLGIAFMQKKEERSRLTFPWFILLFVAATISAYLFPQWQSTFAHVSWLGHKGMSLALFAIGANMAVADIKQAGARSFLMGVMLWLIVAGIALLYLTGAR